MLNLISGFFAFFRLVVWVDGINKCGWCPAGGRGMDTAGDRGSTFVRLSHLYQEFCVHCIVIMNDRGME